MIRRIHASVNMAIDDSDNGLSPIRHQAITLTSVELLSIGTYGTSFSEIWIKTHKFSYQKLNSKKHRLQNGGHVVPVY